MLVIYRRFRRHCLAAFDGNNIGNDSRCRHNDKNDGKKARISQYWRYYARLCHTYDGYADDERRGRTVANKRAFYTYADDAQESGSRYIGRYIDNGRTAKCIRICRCPSGSFCNGSDPIRRRTAYNHGYRHRRVVPGHFVIYRNE